jgi:hypothetical protein
LPVCGFHEERHFRQVCLNRINPFKNPEIWRGKCNIEDGVKNALASPVFLCGYIEERDLASQDALRILLNEIKAKRLQA